MSRYISLITLVLICFGQFAAAGEPFVDPAPPKVLPQQKIQPLAPARYEAVKFHAAPKPLAKNAVVEDYCGFLGTAHAPVCGETQLRDDLKDLPLVWEVSRGQGYSGPAICSDRLVSFHRLGDEEVIECLHRETGQRYWRYAYPTSYQDRYGYNNGPRCMPVIDPEKYLVFTLGAEGKLTALDLATGQPLWKRDILAGFKLSQNFFGVASTPLLQKDLLIINVGAKGACVVGFDTLTGRVRWAAKAPQDWGPSYAAPIPGLVHGAQKVFVFAGGESRPAAGGLLCLDPATGAVDFSFPWRGRRYESVNASAPLVVDNAVFISECYGRGGVLLDIVPPGGTGSASEKMSPKQRWVTDKLATHYMTALPLRQANQQYLYGCDGHSNSPLVCIDLATGDEKWRAEPDLSESMQTEQGPRQVKLSTGRCQLLAVDGKVLCLTEWGHLVYLNLSPDGCKVTSRKWLFAAGETWTPPVISRGLLYICQNQADPFNKTGPRILCYDLRK